MSKTLGLALGAGGARGIAHVGFMKALDEAGIKPDYIAGCSMGAIVGGVYANGMTPADMEEWVHSIKKRDIIDISALPITRMALLRTRKVRDMLLERIGDVRLENFAIPFKCVATDILSGKLHVFEDGPAALAIQASCTIPTVFRPVRHNGMMLVDGGCLCRVPVQTVKEMGADVVVAVDVLTNCAEPVDDVKNIVKLILRVFDVIDNNQTKLRRQIEGEMCDLLIEPVLKGVSAYDIKAAESTLDEGYECGKAAVQKIKELLD